MAGVLGARPPLFSSDARHVYVSRGAEVRAYAVSTGSLVLVFSGHTAAVTGLAEHPSNARQLVTTSLDGTIRTWDTDDAACLYSVNLGVPITHLCAPVYSRTAGGEASGALIYVAAALRGGAAGDDFPLGNEVACLRPRPLATAFAFTVAASGRRRAPPQVAVLEVDLAQRRPSRRLAQGRGFVVGLDGRSLGGAADGRVVVFALRRRLYVWRSGSLGGEGVCESLFHPNAPPRHVCDACLGKSGLCRPTPPPDHLQESR